MSGILPPMNRKRPSSFVLGTSALLLVAAPGCGSKGGDSGSGVRPSGGANSAGAGAGQAPLTPSLAAIAAGTWKDPGGGPDLKLVSTPLDKCYGFKGYSMKLPEGSKLESLMGARSCQAAFPGAKKGFALVVISDELKIPLPKKEDIKDYKEKTYDSPDAFLYKVERKGKTYYAGWWEKKVGKPTLRCNSIASEGGPDFDFDFERAAIELCRTLAYSGL